MDCSRAGLENCLAVAEAAVEAEATNENPDLDMTKKNNYMMLRYKQSCFVSKETFDLTL